MILDVSLWNDAADRVFDAALVSGLLAALAYGVVRLVWSLAGRRATAHLGHLLFLVPLVALITPRLGTIEVPRWVASTPRSAPPAELAEAATGRAAEPGSGALLPLDSAAPTESEGAAEAAAPSPQAPTWKAWLLLAWATLSTSLLVRFVAAQVRTHRLVRRSPALGGAEGARVQALLERIAPRAGVRSRVRVVASDRLATPAVWGVLRPTLALSPSATAALDERQLEWVLLHELAHVARRDLVVGAVQRVIQIAWFFHPVAWLAGRDADELREAACDERALATSRFPDPESGARALVEVAARSFPALPGAPALLLSLQNDKTLMKKRILRMLDPSRVPSTHASPIGAALALALGAAMAVDLTVAQELNGTRAEKPTTPAARAEDGVADAAAKRAHEAAIDWLVARQNPNGGWPTGPGTSVETGELNKIGVTGLVLLAIAGGEESAAREQAIARGRGYLAREQGDDGLFGPAVGSRYMPSHAIATRAWFATRGDRGEDEWRPAGQAAFDAILRARNPYKGWRFNHVPDGDNDVFTTGLMLFALDEASEAGLEVPPRVYRDVMEFVDEMTDPHTLRTGYNQRGSADPRLWGKNKAFPATRTELCTAMGLLLRTSFGEEDQREIIARGAALLTASLPDWDLEEGKIDYYYWAYGTEALAGVGGMTFDLWRDRVMAALVPHQKQDGDGGWWPAIDAWSVDDTTVHATACCALALQAAID
ncbi:MAG: M56 family metallopeptidase [Planctomycetota bacterium]